MGDMHFDEGPNEIFEMVGCKLELSRFSAKSVKLMNFVSIHIASQGCPRDWSMSCRGLLYARHMRCSQRGHPSCV